MATDKKKKRTDKGSPLWLLLALGAGGFLMLVGIYYGKFETLPFGEGRFADFLRFWEWIV